MNDEIYSLTITATGKPGSGKTTFLEWLEARLRHDLPGVGVKMMPNIHSMKVFTNEKTLVEVIGLTNNL